MRIARPLVILALLFSPLIAAAQPLADKIPADTLYYVGWRGAGALGAGYDQSHLKAVVDASDFSSFINEFIPGVMAKIAESDPEAAQVMPVIGALAGPMWRHPTAWCLLGVDMAGRNAPPMPRVLILCDAGNDAPQMAATLKNLLAAAQGGPVPINLVQQGNLVGVAVGNMPPTLDGLLKGAGGASLAADGSFKAAFAQVAPDPVIAVYLNLEGIVGAVNQGITLYAPPEVQAKWPAVRDALGLGSLKRLAVAGGFDGKDWQDSAFLAAPAPRKGLLAGLGAKRLSQDVFKLVPKTAVAVSAGRFSISGFVDALINGITQFEPRAGQMIEAGFQQAATGIGFDVRKDLFAAFGDEWVTYTDPATGGYGLGGSVLINRAANADRLEQSLTRLEQLISDIVAGYTQREKISIAVQTRQVGDITLHYLAIPLITPTWTIKDGNLYVGAYPQPVLAAAQFVGKKGPSILENEGFIAVWKRLGAEKADMFSFVDLPKTAPVNYGPWLAVSRLVGIGDIFGVKSPILLMPSLAVLEEHLAPGGGVSWADDAGWHAKAVNPFPGSQALGTDPVGLYATSGGPALMASILLPSLSRARETANRVKSASNLRMIGQGCMLYANENKGQMPNDLGALIKEDLTPQVFVAPQGDTEQAVKTGGLTPDQQAAWINEHSDYVYVGKGKNFSRLGATDVLAYEKPELNHGQGINVLFGDGHVEFVRMPDAMQLINAPRP